MATSIDPMARGAPAPAWSRPKLALPAVGKTPIPASERRVVDFISVCTALSVLTMKLTIGFANIESTFAIALIATGWLLVTRQARISLAWLTFYLAITTALATWQILNPTPRGSGITGVVYLIVLYIPFLLRVEVSRAAFLLFLKRFQLVCLTIAFMVLLGWAMQLAHLKMLNAEVVVVGPLRFKSYNYIQPIIYGSRFTKPNGFFMLETSHTSQLLAMGFLIELCILQRWMIVGLLGATLLSTFGGTGLMIVLLSSPVVLFYLGRRALLIGAFALPVAALLALQIGLVQNIEKRAGELSGERKTSSGYGRFLLPYQVVGQIAASSAGGALFGAGAGNLPKVDGHEEYVVNPPSKILAEYGIPLGVSWLIWFHSIVLSRGIPFIVSLAPLLQYDFMNGSLLIPINIYYVLFLTGLFVVRKDDDEGMKRG